MIATHGIPERTLTQVAGVLARHPQVARAVLFGSRAKGTFRHGSDIDLALAGAGLDRRNLSVIASELDDLPTPYEFSLVILDPRLDVDVAAHIERVGIPVYERMTTESPA